MPRNGSGVYSLPSGSTAVPNTPIASATQNAILADLVADLNAARPVVAGGTGATTAADARTNLDVYSTGEVDAAISGVSLPRNRIVNGSMQISQERGTTLVDVTTGIAYVIDQVRAVLSSSPGGTLRGQQQAGFTPSGAPNFVRFTAQVADASLASGDYYGFDFPVEGLDVADAQFGTANAVPIIFRVVFRASASGTGHFLFQNSARNRSYVVPFTIAPGEVNTWVTRTAVVPGGTAGTWLTDTGIGLICGVTLASGTTFNGTASAWTGSDIRSVSGATNFMASGGITFDVSEVGLYVDHAGTGVAPPWGLPNFGEELRRCQQYFIVRPRLWFSPAIDSGAGTGRVATDRLPVAMRVPPSINVLSQLNTWSSGPTNTISVDSVSIEGNVASAATGQYYDSYTLSSRF